MPRPFLARSAQNPTSIVERLTASKGSKVFRLLMLLYLGVCPISMADCEHNLPGVQAVNAVLFAVPH